MGPYRIWGYVHPLPTADLLSPLSGHRPIVPLTDATILYAIGDAHQADDLAALAVNHPLVDHLGRTIADADEVALDLDRRYGVELRTVSARARQQEPDRAQ